LENQKAREVWEKDHTFNQQDLEVERKVRCEIVQSRFSLQKGLED